MFVQEAAKLQEINQWVIRETQIHIHPFDFSDYFMSSLTGNPLAAHVSNLNSQGNVVFSFYLSCE